MGNIEAPVEKNRYSAVGWSLRAIGAAHLITAALFMYRPEESLKLLNLVQGMLRKFIETPAATEHFWSTLGSGYALLFGVLCIVLSFSKQFRTMILVLGLVKAVIAAAFWQQYHVHAEFFSYLAGSVLEGLCALWMLGAYLFAILR